MPLDPVKRPDLVDHPLRVAAANVVMNCTIKATFRTYDPRIHDFRRLADARVNLVCSDPNVAPLAGVTDANGDLFDLAAPASRLVVANVQNLAPAAEFHFEVVGPKIAPNANLTAMQYQIDTQFIAFPIASWSTNGWQEPEGQWGNFKLAGPVFPALPERRFFTVGYHLDVALQYIRSNMQMGAYSHNVTLTLARTLLNGVAVYSETRLAIGPGGTTDFVGFEFSPGDKIEVYGYVSADLVPGGDNISGIAGTMTVSGQSKLYTPGELFGFAPIPNLTTIRLYKKQDFTANSLPAHSVDKTHPRVHYTAIDHSSAPYAGLSVTEKQAICFNWFVELVASRNLYIRTMNCLLQHSAHIVWNGMPNLNLTIDDTASGAYTTGTQNMLASLDFILAPTDNVCAHELTHAVWNLYCASQDPEIYYPPPPGVDHYGFSFSNEFFSVSEGFSQFVAALFMEPRDAFYLNAGQDWRMLFKYQGAGGIRDVVFGYAPATMTAANVGLSGGLSIENAFAAALIRFWVEIIWANRTIQPAGEKTWMQNLTGDGAFDPAVNSANSWLADPDLQKKFANYIFDPIFSSDKVKGMYSARRGIDKIEKSTTPGSAWPDITWAALRPLFDSFRVTNRFFISSIVDNGGTECVIVRASGAAFENRMPPGEVLIIDKLGANTLTARGVRIPATVGCKIVQGAAAPIDGVVQFNSEYEIEVSFTGASLAPLQTGTCDLRFETDPLQPASSISFLVKSLSVP